MSAELHEYAGVGHGFGLRLSQHGAVADWPEVFVEWMETKGLLERNEVLPDGRPTRAAVTS